MAFDLVQYFVEQIETQKPELLSTYSKQERRDQISEINALTLGKLISEWKSNSSKLYHEIVHHDPLYVEELARHLSTSSKNQSSLNRVELETTISAFLQLQLLELKQLHDTGGHNQNSIQELLLGQIEHLSGQADDWVWSTNMLTELIGSKPIIQDTLSLEQSMKEFNQMVSQNQHIDEDVSPVTTTPTWSKVVEPVVALVILWVLACAMCNIFA
ncbi:hypothetical protein GFH30_10515 [Acinetobacter wanghuae]|uniref:Uncharacterized protein n=1 Tax=Acinetobacter wanghuae TaxID=2662362 RepID=A0A5Q0P3R8_9GAMM|nr:hypothetical protein [Acinetobacter wanghuae]MQW91309.1 hypothetical protein [Acinetobacter wanghuae]QGA11785.1 hypothetical protein GFH30_10515 [Acinetobacter wanghuae]